MARPSDRDDSIPTGRPRPYPWPQTRRSTDLFFGFGVRAVGDHHFSVSKAQCLGVPNSLEGFSPDRAVVAKYIVVSEAFVHKVLLIACGHCCPRCLVEIAKTNVSQDPSNVGFSRYTSSLESRETAAIPSGCMNLYICFQMTGCGALINAQKSGPDLPIFPLPAIRKPSRL
jgi:hypothetical protein